MCIILFSNIYFAPNVTASERQYALLELLQNATIQTPNFITVDIYKTFWRT